ncbi:hypothetical protein M0Q50_04525 [bacterium]|jgi:hypothetical protein|nr:hypothetical protein [bacterium]
MKIFNNLFATIKKSCERNNHTSSTRIIAYIITVLIIIIVISSLSAGIYIAIVKQTIPNEIVIILGMLLTHQLTLLGINKYHETKQPNNIVEETKVEETEQS